LKNFFNTASCAAPKIRRMPAGIESGTVALQHQHSKPDALTTLCFTLNFSTKKHRTTFHYMENCHVWLLFLVASAVKNFKASAPTQQPRRNNTNRACLVIDRDLAMPTLSMMHSGLAPNLGVVLITSSLSLSYRSHPASSTNNSAALRQKALGTVHRFAR